MTITLEELNAAASQLPDPNTYRQPIDGKYHKVLIEQPQPLAALTADSLPVPSTAQFVTFKLQPWRRGNGDHMVFWCWQVVDDVVV